MKCGFELMRVNFQAVHVNFLLVHVDSLVLYVNAWLNHVTALLVLLLVNFLHVFAEKLFHFDKIRICIKKEPFADFHEGFLLKLK